MTRSFTLLLLTFFSIPSYAYLGPGMSGGFHSSYCRFFRSNSLGIMWGILYYPIKRSLKKRKDKKFLLKKSGNDS